MDINVNIPPADFEKAIVESIVNTALGSRIKAAVESWLTDRQGPSFTTAVQDALKVLVKEELRKWVMEEFGDRIREKVRAAVTEKAVDQAVSDALSRVGWAN